MVSIVAAANCDDHTKIFSFLLPEGDRWQLAPDYDLTHVHDSASQWMRQHLMAVNGTTAGIERVDVTSVADRVDVPGAARIVEQVLAPVDEWPCQANEAEVPEAIAHGIWADLDVWSNRLH